MIFFETFASTTANMRFGTMAAVEYVLIDSNSNQLLYIGPATLTRTTATAPSRGRCGQLGRLWTV